MATHSIVLAWKIPWTEEPGGPQSMCCKESDTTEVTWHSTHLINTYMLNSETHCSRT